jgi:hypothetical protein
MPELVALDAWKLLCQVGEPSARRTVEGAGKGWGVG